MCQYFKLVMFFQLTVKKKQITSKINNEIKHKYTTLYNHYRVLFSHE